MLETLMPVLIVAIVFSFVSFSVFLKHRTDLAKYGAADVSSSIVQENQLLKEKVGSLEERIQILESIVTDESTQLKNEINSLN
mgnify:CR=1 FL=1